MGAGSSTKQHMGERALAAREQLAADEQMASERAEQLKSASPETLDVAVQSLANSLERCSPFSDSLLLVAFAANPEETKRMLQKAVKKVLSAPVSQLEYAWFTQYVFPSTVWMMRAKDGRCMFEHMMTIVKGMTQKIDDSMRSIFEHLQAHREWKQLTAIENQTVVERQDDDRVGLLKENGITDIAEMKDEEGAGLTSFIDTNLAVTTLTATANRINGEFQQHLRAVLSRFGDFRAGPTKTVQRCQSKLENEYQSAQYPKAAKLLDLVRCSVSFNTLEQLLVGYEGLRRHIETRSDSLQLARIKNDFLAEDATFRAIKVNVVYRSQDPLHDVSMICEVQLILNQYLHEKKRIHKLYSILRERAFFEMVVKDDAVDDVAKKDLKQLQFEPVLNVQEQVQTSESIFYKCSVDSELGLLGMKVGKSAGDFLCVDMNSKAITWKMKAQGGQPQRWITRQKQKYLSLQTSKNEVRMFEVDAESKTFKEDESLRLCLGEEDNINFTEFDIAFENIFILTNQKILEKRGVEEINKVTMSLELEKEVKPSARKQLAVSNDGCFCVIGGGSDEADFYVVDLQNAQQQKLSSEVLGDSFVPCFINGQAELVAVGGWIPGPQWVEIWDIKKKKAIQVLKINNGDVECSASTNNILAIATGNDFLGLWDVRSWEMIYSRNFSLTPRSLHLTSDLKYMTIAGSGGEKCIVMEIK